MQPKVSIIIPSLDGYRNGNLPKLLEQINGQTFKDLEILVIKAVSPNGRARNLGARQARGEILIFFDDDVLLGHDKIIENLVTTLKSEKNMGLLGISKQIPPNSNWFQRCSARELPRSTCPIYDKVTEGDLVDHMCLTIYKDLFFKIGMENEFLIRGTDPDLRYRIRRAGFKVAIAPQSWAYHPMPKNLKELLSIRFRNGAGSAWVYRHYPELAIHDAVGHRVSFQAKTNLFYRVISSFGSLLWAAVTLKTFFFLSRFSYGLGYVWGFFTNWSGSLNLDGGDGNLK